MNIRFQITVPKNEYYGWLSEHKKPKTGKAENYLYSLEEIRSTLGILCKKTYRNL